MVELGLILLVLGAICAIACHFAHIPVGTTIGLGVVGLGGVLIVLGYLIPALGGLDVGEPETTGASSVILG